MDVSDGNVLYDLSNSVIGPQRWNLIVLTPDGSRALVSTNQSPDTNGPGNLWIVDVSDGNVLYDISNSVIGPQRWNLIVLTPDGSRALVSTNQSPDGTNGPGNLWIIDLTTYVITPILVLSPPLPLSSSYILGPERNSSALTRFQVGAAVRKPIVGTLDYSFRILQQMSFSQGRL